MIVDGPLEVTAKPKSATDVVNKDYVDKDHSGGNIDVSEEVSGVTVRGGFRSALVFWTGSDLVHGHGYYDVQLDTVNTFNSANLQGEQSKSTFAVFGGLTPDVTYFGRVRGVRADGTVGPWITSIPSDDTPLANSDDIEELTASKISAGTITASISIQAPTITGGTITGGTFQTDSSGARIVITDSAESTITFYRVGDANPAGYIIGSGPNLVIGAQGEITLQGSDAIVESDLEVQGNLTVLGNLGVTAATDANGAYSNGDGSANYTGGAVATTLGAQSGTSTDDGHSHLVNRHKHDLGTHTHTISF